MTRRFSFSALAMLACAQLWAHASLVESTPAEEQVVAVSPEQVTLEFNEPVEPIEISLVDRSGTKVPGVQEARAEENKVLLPLAEQLADGVYVVSYRVVSADTHPTGGAFAFFVGERSAAPKPVVQGSAANGWTNAVGLNRWALYTFVLLAVGSSLFYLLMRVPAAIALAATGIGAVAALLAALSFVLSIGFGGAQMIGGEASILFGARAWSTGASTTLGPSAAIGVPAMLLLWGGLHFRKRLLLAAGVVIGVLSFLVTGHAATASPVPLMSSMVALHLVCAAFWLGSLYPLFQATRLPNVQEAGAVMVTFSRLAVYSVIVLFASGVVISWVQLRSWSAFITTQYGWNLLFKLACFVALLALAAYNKNRLTPRLAAGDAPGATRLRRSIRFEYLLYVLILGAAASLTLTQPPRAIASFSGTAEAQGYRAHLVVTPALAGENKVVVTVTDAAGQPVVLESMNLTLDHAAAGIAGLEKRGERAGASWQFTISETAIAGEWQFTVNAFVNAFDEVDFAMKVPIR